MLTSTPLRSKATAQVAPSSCILLTTIAFAGLSSAHFELLVDTQALDTSQCSLSLASCNVHSHHEHQPTLLRGEQASLDNAYPIHISLSCHKVVHTDKLHGSFSVQGLPPSRHDSFFCFALTDVASGFVAMHQTAGCMLQGHLKFFMKEHDEAMKTYEQGLSHDKDNSELREGLMRCQQAINKVHLPHGHSALIIFVILVVLPSCGHMHMSHTVCLGYHRLFSKWCLEEHETYRDSDTCVC